MKLFYKIFQTSYCLLFFVFITGLQYTKAQVIINEFSAANYDNYLCSNNDYEDWVELYNMGAAPVNLQGYYLSDRVDKPTKWQIPAGYILSPGDRILIIASGEDNVIGGFLHTNFKVTQTDAKEAFVLASPSGAVIDFHEIDIPNGKNHAYARMPDGGPWTVTNNPTPGAANNSTTTRYALTPQFNIQPGYYAGTQSVTLTTTEPNSTIRYTLDGSEPTAASTAYSAPINVSTTRIIKARTYSSDPKILTSHTAFGTYFIGAASKHTMMVVSISGDDVPLLLSGTQNNPQGTFELFDQNGKFIDACTGEFNKHGNDSWAYAQRGIDYVTRDQFGNDSEIKHKIFPNTKRKKFQRIILKAAANDNYPALGTGAHLRDAYVHELSQRAGLDLDVRSTNFCVLYVNGNYWGVYDIREKVDDKDYTDYYYGLDEKEIDFIKTWGSTWAEYGTTANWFTLRNYILTNDMTNPVKFQYVADRLNLQSLIDYYIINVHTVCKDWLVWNTAWWTGMDNEGNFQKWRYTLWDMDAVFGHYINYTNIPNVNADADPCDIETVGPSYDPQKHTEVLTKLFTNKSFFDLYINRYADLNNTFLSCQYMTNLLNEMEAQLEPEMPGQIARWGGNFTTWKNNVKAIRDFINERCVKIETGIVDCYPVQGPYNLVVVVKPEGSPNDVKVNTVIPDQYPFNSKYYGGTDLHFTAMPGTGWDFEKWETKKMPINPNQTSTDMTSSVSEPDTLFAYFVIECPMVLGVKPTGQNYLDCKTGTIQLQAESTNGSGSYTYSWLDSKKNIIPGSNAAVIDITQAGWYYATVEDVINGCSRTDSFLVLDKKIYPNAIASVNDKLTCTNLAVDFITTGTDTGPAFSYQWSGVCLEASASSLSNKACAPGQYTLVVTDNSNGCTALVNLQVDQDIKKPDDVSINAASVNLPCDGSGVLLSVSGNGPNGNYTQIWSTKTGNILGDPTSNVVNANASAWYFLTITNPENGCTHTDSILLKNNNTFLSSLSFNLKNPSCDLASNGEISVVAQGGGTPFTYSLNGSALSAVSTFGNLTPGTYTILIENSDKCQFDTTISIIVVENLPQYPGIKTIGASCDVAQNGGLEFTSQTGGFGPYTYSLNGSAYSTQTVYSNLAPGIVGISVKDDAGCIASYNVAVPVSEDLPDQFATLPDGPNCSTASNGSLEINNISGGVPPYEVSFNNGPFGNILTASNLSAGDIQISIKDALGCIFNTVITLNADENLPSDYKVKKSEPACENGTNGKIEISNISGGVGPYQVTLNGITSPSGDDVFPSLTVGIQKLLITDALGCTYEDDILIKAGGVLVVDLGEDLLVDDGSSVPVTATIYGNDITNISWTPEICLACTSAVVTVLSDTTLKVTVTDIGGCSTEDELVIKIKENVDLYAANIFSPNGDGYNDTWRLQTSNPFAILKQLAIFDRWGGMMFTASGGHPSADASAWDGTVKGKKCPAGVYVFMAEVTVKPGRTVLLKGEIAITR
ncbi:MAG TPA: CotH kinase family protein [Saprospiraceae bacterium]|nr:CotH kinase family protein [Saprospiraceae bacterium]